MQKLKPTALDYLQIAITPRWYNLFFWLFIIGFYIVNVIRFIIVGIVSLYEETKNYINGVKESYDERKTSRYSWRSGRYMSYREYLDELGEAIKKRGDMKVTQESCDLARKFDMEAEVVASAMNAMKANPKLSLEEAFILGFQEWDI